MGTASLKGKYKLLFLANGIIHFQWRHNEHILSAELLRTGPVMIYELQKHHKSDT